MHDFPWGSRKDRLSVDSILNDVDITRISNVTGNRCNTNVPWSVNICDMKYKVMVVTEPKKVYKYFLGIRGQ